MTTLHFRDFLLMQEILETLEDKELREDKLLEKVNQIVKEMKAIHAYKDRIRGNSRSAKS